MNKASELAASVWGTGFGSRRHLIDHERAQLRVPDKPGSCYVTDLVPARCSPSIYLAYVDGGTDKATVTGRRPCARRLKLATDEGQR